MMWRALSISPWLEATRRPDTKREGVRRSDMLRRIALRLHGRAVTGGQAPIIRGSGAHYRAVKCSLYERQVPILRGSLAHYGVQVPITGGSGVHLMGFRCPV